MENRRDELNMKLREDGFTHNFESFGHDGWGHCVVCHSTVDVNYPENNDKECPGTRPKRIMLTGLEYDCCSKLTSEDWKKIKAMEEKIVKEINDQIERNKK
ncbi:MAG: hypothetical protein AAB958_00180 [Patescibacteria group bacterium]